MTRSSLRIAIVAGVIAVTPTLASATNLVVDGNFDAPSGGGSFTTYFSGGSFGPWNVTGTGSNSYGGAGVDLIGGYWQAPNNVGGSVDLDGDAPGGVSQSLGLVANQHYTLSFYLSGNPDGGSTTKTVDVTIGSLNEILSYTTGLNSHGDMMYSFESVRFTAGSTNILSFSSQDNIGSPFGPVVGGVSVTAVPELSTWAMMLAGFAGLGFVGYYRNRSARVAA